MKDGVLFCCPEKLQDVTQKPQTGNMVEQLGNRVTTHTHALSLSLSLAEHGVEGIQQDSGFSVPEGKEQGDRVEWE